MQNSTTQYYLDVTGRKICDRNVLRYKHCNTTKHAAWGKQFS